jgi:hypothetical protein
MMTDDHLLVSGNTDRPFTAAHREAAERLLENAVNNVDRPAMPAYKYEADYNLTPARGDKDASKFRALSEGNYPPGEAGEQWMNKFNAARKKIVWDMEVKSSSKMGHNVHGEMNLLEQAIKDGRQERSGNEGGLLKIPLATGRKPCRACGWVIDSVNKIIGESYNFEITSSPTHNNRYENWNLPEWLLQSDDPLIKQVLESVKEKASKDGAPFDKNGRLTKGNDKKQQYEFPPESDSEHELRD